ncbi:hypothetical protein [Nannocystis bainbridge]|uniref:Uncharacterized protein n=1 Tax=Nannocystis bainbridge TaxID=2995303 RepID=A0ABT5EAJ3_9BACT|nr:hypothetical protein [Nannocystis bainbridge]MDC0722869.1 hypothetical protein [Nannocystis bainbridge]
MVAWGASARWFAVVPVEAGTIAAASITGGGGASNAWMTPPATWATAPSPTANIPTTSSEVDV